MPSLKASSVAGEAHYEFLAGSWTIDATFDVSGGRA